MVGVAGGYARGKAYQRDLAHLRENRLHWLRLSASLALSAVAMRCVFVLADLPGGGFVTGFFLGMIGMALTYEFRISSGSAPIHRGAETEQQVDEMLRQHAPKGWQIRSALSFADGDVDHVLIGDSSVVMIETKSTGTKWRITDDGVTLNGVDPTVRANRSLGRVRRLITGGASAGIDGSAWLVLQSPSEPDRDALLPTVRNGVEVFKTRHLAEIVASLDAIEDHERVAANTARVDKFLADRRRHELKMRTSAAAAS